MFEYSRIFSWPQHTLSFNYMVIYAKIWEQGQVWKEASGHPCFDTLVMAQKYTHKKIHRPIFMQHQILTSTFFNDRSLAIPLHFCSFFSFQGKAQLSQSLYWIIWLLIKGVFSKSSGNCIVAPFLCFLRGRPQILAPALSFQAS